MNYDQQWVVVLDKTLLQAHSLYFAANFPKTTGFYCFTFQTKSDKSQVLISTYRDTRHEYSEIRCTSTEIHIKNGKFKEIVQHNCRKWTTFQLEFVAGEHITERRYTINNNPHL